MALDLTLDPDKLCEQAHKWLKGDLDRFVAAYESAVPDQGKVLDPDRAKRLFLPGETRPEIWTRYGGALYAPARELIEELFRRRLGRGKPEGLFVFTAGGPGSGKTTLQNFYREDSARGGGSIENPYSAAESIMDGTFADWNKARAWVKAALLARKRVCILFIYRELVATVNGVIDRALAVPDRVIRLSSVIPRHFDAPRTVLATAAQFRDENLEILCFRCVEGDPLSVAPMTLADVEEATANADLATMQAEAYAVLETRRPELPPPLYDAFCA